AATTNSIVRPMPTPYRAAARLVAASLATLGGMDKPKLTITYCTQCNWLLRAGWMAQEVLSTFSLEMGEVSLIPGTGGIYQLHLDGELIWDRKRDGGFPDVKHLKQMVRDRIDPDRDLGHIDRPHGPAAKKPGWDD